MQSLDIVKLLQNNPVTKLSSTYQNKLLLKLKENFTDTEQQMFLTSFYCYLHFKAADYVIDLDNIWEWLGFKQKVNAKKLLEKHFKLDTDYSMLSPQRKQNKNGGNNKETFMLTVNTFKSLCLKAATSKAGQIHEYYIKLENTLHEIIDEQTDELKKQLENKQEQLDTCLANSDIEKKMLREQTILQQFPENKQCVYYATINNKNDKGETLIKFGCSNFLQKRVLQHKKVFDNFRLVNAFEVQNKIHVENAIKSHPKFKNSKSNLLLNSKNHTEMFVIDDKLTIDIIDKIFQFIVKGFEHSPENYSRVFDENIRLLDENARLLDENYRLKLQQDNIRIKKIVNKKSSKLCINNIQHKSLFGTRDEVWNGSAYKTTGDLTKLDLVLGKNGKIVSKLRHEQGKKNHLELTKLFRKQSDSSLDKV